MNKLILFLISLLPYLPHAQVYEWHHTFGGVNWEEASDLITDEDANIYNTGSFLDSFDADPSAGTFTLTSAGERDIFIRKNDSDGNLIWAKQIGGVGADSPSTLTFDNEGNLLVIGIFSGTVDFDPGVGVSSATSNGLYDCFILKLTEDGNFVWVKTYGGANSDYPQDIASAEDGSLYVSGAYRETCDFDFGAGVHELTSVGFNDAYVLKLTEGGDFIWVNGYGSTSSDGAKELELSSSGGVVVAGRFSGEMDVDPSAGVTLLTGVAGNDCYVLEYSAEGTLIWAGAFGSPALDGVGDMVKDTEGNYILTGFFGGTADFDMGDGVASLTADGYNDIFVLKITADGEYVWAHGFGEDEESEGRGIALDMADNVYVTGYFSGAVDFDPGDGIFVVTSESASDSFILKLDNDGNFIDALPISGTANTFGRALAIDPENAICTIGRHSGTTDFDPSDGVVSSASTAGSFDFYLLKIGQDPICLPTTGSFSTTECDSYNSPSGLYTWTSSGIYTDTLVNAGGCDSIITINLTVNHAMATELSEAVCETYTSPSGLYTWTESGLYYDTLATVSGCDSILTIDLTVNFPSAATLNETTCDTYVSPSGLYTWTSTGTYTDTLTNALGCDSIITVNLTVNEVNTTVEQDGIVLTATATGATYQWVNCDNGYSIIEGANDAEFIATANGNYAVIVTQGECADTSACVNVNNVGIFEGDIAPHVLIYPNPATHQFNIKFNKNQSDIYIEIVDVTGAIVYRAHTENTNHVQLYPTWSEGTYFVTVRTGNGMVSILKLQQN